MSRQMVESTLFRARRKLAEEYDELASGRRCHEVQAVIESGRALSARSLGIRERRRLARHLAHCQPCRVNAHLAGVDESLLRPGSIADKIAALLPFGLWKWLLRSEAGTKRALAKTGSHPVAIQSVQIATSMPDTARAASSLGGAAVAAAVIALAGAGGAIVSADAGAGHARRTPGVMAPASPRTATEREGRAARRQRGTCRRRRAVPVRSARPRRGPCVQAAPGHEPPGRHRPAGWTRQLGARLEPEGRHRVVRAGGDASADPGKQATKAMHAGSSTLHRAGSTGHKVLNTVKTTTGQTGKTLSKTASRSPRRFPRRPNRLATPSPRPRPRSARPSHPRHRRSGRRCRRRGHRLARRSRRLGRRSGRRSRRLGRRRQDGFRGLHGLEHGQRNGLVAGLAAPGARRRVPRGPPRRRGAVTGTVKKAASTVSSTVPGLLR